MQGANRIAGWMIRSLTVLGHFYRLDSLAGVVSYERADGFTPNVDATARIIEFGFSSTLTLHRQPGKTASSLLMLTLYIVGAAYPW
jgi:hypothetical protein